MLPVADELVDRLRQILVAEDSAALDALVREELYQKIDPLTELIGNLSVLQNLIAGERVEQARADFVQTLIIELVLVALAIILTVIYGGWLIKKLRRPLAQMENHFEAIETNDSS